MPQKIVCQNRKAFHDYFIVEKFETGIVLKGSEVKSLRAGRANIKESYARIMKGELFLIGAHINPYAQVDQASKPDPLRTRKLLVHKRELRKFIGKIKEEGYTLVPLKMYFRRGKAKVEIGLAKGKKLHDKRESIKRKDSDREMARALKKGRQ
ncbi:tmRNA-binding protein SmpB [hydrothermal vent metagenome]|uniref:TmRNA-binding protein SmpB n=1 Tax=hydrothermal vent metagenome TaxID=652676 RepID=A0A3B0VX13_9ZZZZ